MHQSQYADARPDLLAEFNATVTHFLERFGANIMCDEYVSLLLLSAASWGNDSV